MLDSLAARIGKYLICNNVISKDDFPVYKYGLELLISSIIETVVICSLGAIFFSLFDAIVFIVCFVLLRSFCGGFHASSYLRCTIYSTLTFSAVAIMAEYVHIDLTALAIMSMIDLTVIIIFSPVENSAKPIDQDHKPRLKIISVAVCIAFIILSFVLCVYGIKYSDTIIYSITSVCILAIIGKIKERTCIKTN